MQELNFGFWGLGSKPSEEGSLLLDGSENFCPLKFEAMKVKLKFSDKTFEKYDILHIWIDIQILKTLKISLIQRVIGNAKNSKTEFWNR